MLGVYVIPNVQSSVIQIAVRHCGVGSASYRMFRHPFQIAVYNVEWGLFHTRSSVIYSRSQCAIVECIRSVFIIIIIIIKTIIQLSIPDRNAPMWRRVCVIPGAQSSIPVHSAPLWSGICVITHI